MLTAESQSFYQVVKMAGQAVQGEEISNTKTEVLEVVRDL